MQFRIFLCEKKKIFPKILADSTMQNRPENFHFNNDLNLLNFDRKLNTINNNNNMNSTMSMKELKMVHRNQTILTGGLMAHYDSDNSGNFPFDFSQFASAQKRATSPKLCEPMELEQQQQQYHHRSSCAAAIETNIKTGLIIPVLSVSALSDKDTEMRSIEIVARNTIMIPVRPTTLHLSGPHTYTFFCTSIN